VSAIRADSDIGRLPDAPVGPISRTLLLLIRTLSGASGGLTALRLAPLLPLATEVLTGPSPTTSPCWTRASICARMAASRDSCSSSAASVRLCRVRR